MLKIKSSVLSEYLKKIRIPGESEIHEFVIKTEKDGMICKAMAGGVGAVGVDILLNRKAFQNYEEGISITVGEGKKLQDYIDRFSDVIELHVKDNRLIILSPKKKAEMILASKDFIKEDAKLPDFKFKDYMTLEPEVFSETLKNKILTKSDYITVVVKDKVLYMSAGEKDFDVFTEKVEKINFKDVKSLYAAGVESVFGQISEKCKVALKDNFPMEIKMKTDMMDIKYFIAPRAEEGETKKEDKDEEKEKDEEGE